jgi:hypothetical protein
MIYSNLGSTNSNGDFKHIAMGETQYGFKLPAGWYQERLGVKASNNQDSTWFNQ